MEDSEKKDFGNSIRRFIGVIETNGGRKSPNLYIDYLILIHKSDSSLRDIILKFTCCREKWGRNER